MSFVKPITKISNHLFGVIEFDDKYLIAGAYYNKNLNQLSLLDIKDIPEPYFSNRHQMKPFNSNSFIINVANQNNNRLYMNLNQFLSYDENYKFQAGILIDNNTKYLFSIPFSDGNIFIKDINGFIRNIYTKSSISNISDITSKPNLFMRTNTPNKYLVYEFNSISNFKILHMFNTISNTMSSLISLNNNETIQVLKVIDNRVIIAISTASNIQIRQLDTNTNTFTNITTIDITSTETKYISQPIIVGNYYMYYVFYIKNRQLYYRTITADYSQANLTRIFTISNEYLINNINDIQTNSTLSIVPVITKISDNTMFLSVFFINNTPYFRHNYINNYNIISDSYTYLQQANHIYTFSISANYGLTYVYDFSVAPDTITGIDIINENNNLIFITTKMGGYLLNLSQDGWQIVNNINKSLTSYMRDSLNRMWMIDFQGNLYMSTIGLPYRIVVKPEKTSYNYVSGEILSYVDIDAYDIYNNRVAIDGKLIIKSENAIFIDGSKEKDISTSTTGSTRVSFKIIGGGMLSISFIPRYRVNSNG